MTFVDPITLVPLDGYLPLDLLLDLELVVLFWPITQIDTTLRDLDSRLNDHRVVSHFEACWHFLNLLVVLHDKLMLEAELAPAAVDWNQLLAKRTRLLASLTLHYYWWRELARLLQSFALRRKQRHLRRFGRPASSFRRDFGRTDHRLREQFGVS